MAIPPQFLEDVRARIHLADVIGRRTKLTRKGREHMGLCPFHKEKTPSFYVYDDHYHCFGCQAHGSVFDFVMQTESLTFPEAVERLAETIGLRVPEESLEERARAEERGSLYDVTEAATAYFEKMLRMPEGKAALDYLAGRGLDEATIGRFRLGFAPDSRGALKTALVRAGITEDKMVAAGLLKRPDDGRPPFDYFRGRVMFPITDARGRVVAFGGRMLGPGEPKYLNSPETPLFRKSRILYGLAGAAPAARKAGRIIVTEGYMDVIALKAAGFENAVAPLGTSLTDDHIQELWRIVATPVLCFDGDAAGQRAAGRAALKALPLLRPGLEMHFATLPEGEDPDSLIRTRGAEAMGQVLGGALRLSEVIWRMESAGKVPEAPEERAALEKRLKAHAFEIQDEDARRHFLSFIRDRVWRRRTPANPRRGRGESGRYRGGPEPRARRRRPTSTPGSATNRSCWRP